MKRVFFTYLFTSSTPSAFAKDADAIGTRPYRPLLTMALLLWPGRSLRWVAVNPKQRGVSPLWNEGDSLLQLLIWVSSSPTSDSKPSDEDKGLSRSFAILGAGL